MTDYLLFNHKVTYVVLLVLYAFLLLFKVVLRKTMPDQATFVDAGMVGATCYTAYTVMMLSLYILDHDDLSQDMLMPMYLASLVSLSYAATSVYKFLFVQKDS